MTAKHHFRPQTRGQECARGFPDQLSSRLVQFTPRKYWKHWQNTPQKYLLRAKIHDFVLQKIVWFSGRPLKKALIFIHRFRFKKSQLHRALVLWVLRVERQATEKNEALGEFCWFTYSFYVYRWRICVKISLKGFINVFYKYENKWQLFSWMSYKNEGLL